MENKIDTKNYHIEVLEGMLLNKEMQFDEYNAIQEAVQIMKAVQQSVQRIVGYACPNCGSDSETYHSADCPANPHNR